MYIQGKYMPTNGPVSCHYWRASLGKSPGKFYFQNIEIQFYLAFILLPFGLAASLAIHLSMKKGCEVLGQVGMVPSHWSSSYVTAFSLVEFFIVMKYFHGVAIPALIGH